jgi:L,D-transpeptidase YcbB
MSSKGFLYVFLFFFLFIYVLPSCNSPKPPETAIVTTPQELNVKVADVIRGSLDYAAENGSIDDTIQLFFTKSVRKIYENNQFASLWSSEEKWTPLGDSMRNFISHAKLYGLFPDDYHYRFLDSLNNVFIKDSLAQKERRDAVLWAKSDLVLTDAFVRIVKDLKLGRLPQDSVTLRKDSVLADEFYVQQIQQVQQKESLTAVLDSLEPKHWGYQSLKSALKNFLDSADYKVYTIVPSIKDINFKPALQKRLFEAGFIASDSLQLDSVQLADAVKKFQEHKKIKVDGKVGEGTLRMLNTSDRDRFVQIAITLDRYKMLPDTMPSRYIWVNLPGYYMKLIEADSTAIWSRIICGKNITRTPLLTSAISELITFPQWNIPNSIIVKEILPGVKRDTAYLAKRGYSLIDNDGNLVDPKTVNWTKYTKGIPYKVIQGSGDENALGILKFNFPNKYAVYLHDTNQRYLFSRDTRSLSHGCVRVQQWESLAYNIVRNDYKEKYGLETSPVEDSLTAWLVRKEKHSIPVRKKLPVYIRYFTCDGKDGQVVFYDDIYGEDRLLREQYFADK